MGLVRLLALVSFWLLTLGLHPRWAGQYLPVAGPFALVSQLPFFSGNRYPSRYSVMLLLCVAVLAAAGLYWLLAGFQARRGLRLASAVSATVAALFVRAPVGAPAPQRFTHTGHLRRLAPIAAEDSVLLELPTGWRNGARCWGKVRSVDHAARVVSDHPRAAAARRQHQPQPSLQVPVLHRGAADRRSDRPNERGSPSHRDRRRANADGADQPGPASCGASPGFPGRGILDRARRKVSRGTAAVCG